MASPSSTSARSAPRDIARRTDLWADGRHDGEFMIRYRSGHVETTITRMTRDGGPPLDSHALALLIALSDLWRRGECTTVRVAGQTRRAVRTTARELTLAVLGRDDGRAYRRLGIADHGHGAPGALQALLLTLWIADVKFLPRGDEDTRSGGVITHQFALIERAVWGARSSEGEGEQVIYVVVSPELETALHNGAVTPVPIEIMRLLTRAPDAGRVALHVLSHHEIPVLWRREIGGEAILQVVGSHPATVKTANQTLRKIVRTIAQADAEHQWRFQAEHRGQVGKVICERIHQKEP